MTTDQKDSILADMGTLQYCVAYLEMLIATCEAKRAELLAARARARGAIDGYVVALTR